MDAPTGITLATLITVVGGLLQQRYALKKEATKVKGALKREHEDTNNRLNDIHVLVDGRLTAALHKITRLEKQLGLEPTEEEPPK